MLVSKIVCGADPGRDYSCRLSTEGFRQGCWVLRKLPRGPRRFDQLVIGADKWANHKSRPRIARQQPITSSFAIVKLHFDPQLRRPPQQTSYGAEQRLLAFNPEPGWLGRNRNPLVQRAGRIPFVRQAIGILARNLAFPQKVPLFLSYRRIIFEDSQKNFTVIQRRESAIDAARVPQQVFGSFLRIEELAVKALQLR